MLDQFAALFKDNQVQSITQMLGSVSNFASFVEQKVEGDAHKFNQAIDFIKQLLDGHKKPE